MLPRRLTNILSGLRKDTWMKELLLINDTEVFIVGGTVRDAYRDEDIKDMCFERKNRESVPRRTQNIDYWNA